MFKLKISLLITPDFILISKTLIVSESWLPTKIYFPDGSRQKFLGVLPLVLNIPIFVKLPFILSIS